ncbi:D-beta-hydroxybutyrate dehydrogenase, mitochondrial-like [Haliotis rufescens]|uniref:D-beta-hydroxybutyrate dehydrogenase, mitochondrial-like n=1 Tax=Haliotis rufescens TaxID=6454 RepID=UPI001EB01D57|nr:D-beta-hydroxybutyrate dehydrogenase, mitochondrial-like [Haliotis rufescens]
MENHTLLGLITAAFGLLVYMVQPEPLRSVVLTNEITSIVFYVAIVALTLVLMRKAPEEDVDSGGKAVFITGCDSGFGYNLAVRLDKLGFTVFAGCLMPDREGARQLNEDTSDKLHIVKVDVTDDWQVRGALKYVKENLKENVLWALVNNAGIAVFTEIEWCSVDQFQRVMDVNVFGVVRVTKAFLPLIRPSKGRVINVASLAGRFTLPAFSAYSMSKKACIAFSDGLRLEMAKFDVNVITIEPGLYRTPIASENYLIDMNRKSWAETPKEVKNDYGEEYFDAFLENITQQMKRARPNTNEVVDLMVKAVTTAKPKQRYVPYWKSDVRAHILMSLPGSITDKLFKAYTVKVEVESKRRASDREKSNGTPSPIAK